MMSEEEAEREDITGPDDEDIINSKVEEEMRLRGRLPHISFFAFTATPKNKTMELFGTPVSPGGYEPFSLYPMKQAKEMIIDKDDAPILALALTIENEGLWTYNTKDFETEKIKKHVRILGTKDILKLYPLE